MHPLVLVLNQSPLHNVTIRTNSFPHWFKTHQLRTLDGRVLHNQRARTTVTKNHPMSKTTASTYSLPINHSCSHFTQATGKHSYLQSWLLTLADRMVMDWRRLVTLCTHWGFLSYSSSFSDNFLSSMRGGGFQTAISAWHCHCCFLS